MFKKIMAFCVIGTFSICTLHAQNQNDTVPPMTPPSTDSVPKTDTTTRTDTTKAMSFVMNRENLRSLNVQVKDTVPSDTTKKDTTNMTVFVLSNQKGVKTIFENNAESKENLRIYAIKSKVE